MSSSPTFVVDASVWVSSYVPRDAFHSQSQAWIREHVERDVGFACPSIVMPEVAGAVARNLGSFGSGRTAATEVTSLSVVSVYPLDSHLAQLSATIAADIRLRGADSTYVALAANLGIPLVTWDQELLERASKLSEVRTPIHPT